MSARCIAHEDEPAHACRLIWRMQRRRMHQGCHLQRGMLHRQGLSRLLILAMGMTHCQPMEDMTPTLGGVAGLSSMA